MKFKFTYEHPDKKKHVRYYSALNAETAKAMFTETVEHSIKEPVKIVNICCADNERWKPIKK